MDNFATALKKSSINFENYFKEAVLVVLGGEFEVVEGVTKYQMAKTLDMLAGIDLWHFNTKHGIRGVANRIQDGKNWRTFTVRKNRDYGINTKKKSVKTEYEKRKSAIEGDFLYPILTLQGYLSYENKVLGFAIAKTKDIIAMIDSGYYKINRTGPLQDGQAEFYIVSWDDMKAAGHKIYEAGPEP